MNEKLNELRINTIEGVCAAIEKLLDKPGKTDKPNAAMRVAFSGLLDLLDHHGGYDVGISRVITQVRSLLNIPKEKTHETNGPT